MFQSELETSSNSSSSTEILELASQTELLRLLECPVCKEVPFPPIFNCRSGHIICNSCKAKLKYCALCKQTFSEARNFTVEDIVISSKHACKYKENGCPSVMMGDLMVEHITKCPFRGQRAICHLGRYTNCSCHMHNTSVPLTKYLEHLKETHMMLPSITKSPGIVFESHVLVESKDTFWLGDYQSYDSKIFIVRQFMKDDIVYFSIGVVGDEAIAKRYFADIKITSAVDQFSKVEWTVPVHGIGRSEEEIIDRYCAALPFKYLKTHGKIMGKNLLGRGNRKEKISFFVEYLIHEKDFGLKRSSSKLNP